MSTVSIQEVSNKEQMLRAARALVCEPGMHVIRFIGKNGGRTTFHIPVSEDETIQHFNARKQRFIRRIKESGNVWK